MRRLIFALTLILATACSSGLRSNAPATQVYVLRATTAPGALQSAKPMRGSLQVARPSAGPGLESERIVIVESDHRMSFYAGSRWAAELPALVESLATERLQGSGAWEAVNASQSSFASEYYLQITIRRFEAEYSTDAAPTARVSFDCAIGERAEHTLLATFTAQGAAVASANHMKAVVAAFEQAANAALTSVAEESQAAVKTRQVPSTP